MWGQGATTFEEAWNKSTLIGPPGSPEPSEFWLVFLNDINDTGDDWIDPNDFPGVIPILSDVTINTTLLAGTTSQYLKKTFDHSSLRPCPAAPEDSPNYEEWFIIKMPSTGNFEVDMNLTFPFEVNGTTFSWYYFDATDAVSIAGCNDSPVVDPFYIDSRATAGTFNLLSFVTDKEYIALRIGNNKHFFDGFVSSYQFRSPSTTNNHCEEAINYPDNPIPVDPYVSKTNLNNLNGTDEISTEYFINSQSPNITGSNDLVLPSAPPAGTTKGGWFKITTEQDQLFFTACGSSLDVQLLIFDECPTNSISDPNNILGAENNNLSDGSDLNSGGFTHFCLNPADLPGNKSPVIHINTNTSFSNPKTFYAYLFGNNSAGKYDFYIFGEPSNILPVDWLYFIGTPTDSNNKLEWSTATETQNDHFIVEKSVGGIEFEEFALVPGNGDAIFTNKYLIFDESPYYQTYYRISQVDFDGSINKGPETVVINPNNIKQLFIVNNLILDEVIILNYNFDKDNQVHFSLYSIDGNLKYDKSIDFSAGRGSFTIQIPGLIPGLYILKTRYNNTAYSEKVVLK